jgi:UDP-galactopyranose mutase
VRAKHTYFAGRLANYVYIDMEDCMRQELDAGEELIHDLSRRPRRARASSR